MDTAGWPIYYKENLVLGSEQSSIGIATLWTPREVFASKLDEQSFKVIGQLYSNTGINPLIRNTLANPTIRTIIICGQDKIQSAEALVQFFANGINERREVIGKEEVVIDKEIPKKDLDHMRQQIEIIDMREELDAKNVQKAIDKCTQDTHPWAEAQIYPEIDIETNRYPSEGTLFTYRGKTVAEVWPKLLHTIMRFGEEKQSHHTSGTQRELLNIAAIITQECPTNIDFAEYFPFTKEHFEKYKSQIMTAKEEPSLSYTYGKRLRNADGINQVQKIIAKLQKEPFSRRGIGMLWNVQLDNDSSHPPCLNLVHACIKDDLLFLTAYFRSNDMFRAWPENALALRTMQKEIADALDKEMGHLITISGSAHIYEESYQRAQEIISRFYPSLPCEQDPRGNYVIRIIPEHEIEVLHLSPSGKKLDRYTGTTAVELMNTIVRDQGVSVFSHACDLGAELQKAEIALTLGIEYTQDRPLPLKDIKKHE